MATTPKQYNAIRYDKPGIKSTFTKYRLVFVVIWSEVFLFM